MHGFVLCQAESESSAKSSDSRGDSAMSEELSQSEDEAAEDELQRYINLICHLKTFCQGFTVYALFPFIPLILSY